MLFLLWPSAAGCLCFCVVVVFGHATRSAHMTMAAGAQDGAWWQHGHVLHTPLALVYRYTGVLHHSGASSSHRLLLTTAFDRPGCTKLGEVRRDDPEHAVVADLGQPITSLSASRCNSQCLHIVIMPAACLETRYRTCDATGCDRRAWPQAA